VLKLHLTPVAEDDLALIWAHIALDKISAANRMVDKLRASAANLAQFPGLGPARDDLAPGLRTFPVGKYIIGYRVVGDVLEVVRIVHGMRKLEWLFRK
jgi:toxin ParE1/3/4